MTEPTIRLVVNADDFGMSPSISRGILRAHQEGIVTSTSVVGNCDDVQGVAALLRDVPELGVGVHLTLVGGRPVAPADTVPSLTDGGEALRPGVRDFLMAWAKNRIDPAEVDRELDAQVRRLLEAGLAIDHLDTHRHLGFLPAVGRAMEAVARRHGIPGLRTTFEGPTLSWLAEPRRGLEAGLFAGLAWVTRRQLGVLKHGPRSWGFVETGQLDEVRILEIVGRLGPGAHELICHPGETDEAAPEPSSARYRRVQELAALSSPKVRSALARRRVALCRWRDLF